jgi:hypothetical protein
MMLKIYIVFKLIDLLTPGNYRFKWYEKGLKSTQPQVLSVPYVIGLFAYY